jgi:hypothetical protein
MKKLFLVLFAFVPISVYAQFNDAAKGENLRLDWPESEHWKVGDNQENGQQHVVDMIHEGETIDKWTELGNMSAVKGVKNIPMDTAMNMMFSYAQKEAPAAKLTFIKKGEMQECPWIIFTIESPRFTSDPNPESQLWFILQGKQGLYTNFVAVKKAKLPEDFKTKWTAFFLKGKLVYN